jgi:hypothetical protein
MKIVNVNNTGARGWFIGKFPEAAIYNEDFELCYTSWPIGPIPAHYHTSSTEAILIISGKCLIDNNIIGPGEMFILNPGDINNSNFLEPSVVLGIKFPAGANDKVLL